MRKLPAYIIVDTSYSMRGESIKQINEGFQQLLQNVRKDPILLETLYLSIIEFNSAAKQILPLTSVLQIEIPELSAKGRSNMGAALKLLKERILEEVKIQDIQIGIKGDYKPIVYLLTDGGPSDSWKNNLRNLKKGCNPRIISFGAKHAHMDVLKAISEDDDVIDLELFDDGVTSFFEIISQSLPIYTKSIVVKQANKDEMRIKELPGLNNDYSYEKYF